MEDTTPKLVGTSDLIGSDTILNLIEQNIKDAELITIITDYINEDGWNLLDPLLTNAFKRKCPIWLFSNAGYDNTDYSLLDKLNKDRENFYGMIFHNERIKMSHAKIWVFDKPKESVIIVGSANITKSALCENLELGVELKTQKNTSLYKAVSWIIKIWKDHSHKPNKDEIEKYEVCKHKKLVNTSEISKIKDFRCEMSFDTSNLDLIKEYPSNGNNDNGKKKSKNKTNDALTEFTGYVLQHKNEFSQHDNFKLLLRIYANMLDYREKQNKPTLKDLLSNLPQSIKIDKNILNKIYENSKEGKYLSMSRSIRAPFNITNANIEATLELFDGICKTTEHEKLLDAFITFYKNTKEMKPSGLGVITGILSCLKPNDFVACTSRTRKLANDFEPEYRKYIRCSSFDCYPYLNEIFRYISEHHCVELSELDRRVGGLGTP